MEIHGAVTAEILWRGNRTNGDADWDMGITQEKNNFPPTLYGSGRINPTQNLVDAFPMANGYPITDTSNSGYDALNPYANRDPRLTNYILYNGSTYKGKTIITGLYADSENKTDDGLNKIGTSTRTGYYLRKLLREDCNPLLVLDIICASFYVRIVIQIRVLLTLSIISRYVLDIRKSFWLMLKQLTTLGDLPVLVEILIAHTM